MLTDCWQLHSQPGTLFNFPSNFPSLSLGYEHQATSSSHDQVVWGLLVALHSQHQQFEPGTLSLVLSYPGFSYFASQHQVCLYFRLKRWCAGCWPRYLVSWGIYTSQHADDVTHSLQVVNHVPLYVCFNGVHATMILLLECYYIETAT